MGLNYNYQGALEPVKVKIVEFTNAPNYIFSVEQWEHQGGWRGCIKDGLFPLRDVIQVLDGQMDPREFEELGAWEG